MDLALYSEGRRQELPLAGDRTGDGGAVEADLHAALDARARAAGGFVWLGLADPTPAELDAARQAFGLHTLAVADTRGAHQRPKVEHDEQHLFVILKTLWYVEEEDAVETGELAVFLGADFVVTVRRGHGIGFSRTRAWLEEHPEILAHGPHAVLYAVCAHVVQEYGRVVESLETDVDQIETSVFSDDRTNDSERIYTVKREIAEVRRAVHPLRDPLHRFAVGGQPDQAAPAAARPYFRSVVDDLSRVAESIDALDALVSAAFDAHVARISVQQNEDMRKISAGAALVVVPTLIAGIYGMNFTYMPELDWRYGYPFALIVMGLSALWLWWVFRRSGWW